MHSVTRQKEAARRLIVLKDILLFSHFPRVYQMPGNRFRTNEKTQIFPFKQSEYVSFVHHRALNRLVEEVVMLSLWDDLYCMNGSLSTLFLIMPHQQHSVSIPFIASLSVVLCLSFGVVFIIIMKVIVTER